MVLALLGNSISCRIVFECEALARSRRSAGSEGDLQVLEDCLLLKDIGFRLLKDVFDAAIFSFRIVHALNESNAMSRIRYSPIPDELRAMPNPT